MLSTSSHVYSELFVHLNWHCKDDTPLIVPAVEAPLSEEIRNYCRKCKGIDFVALGGTEDHVHLLIQFEPFICLSEWIGKVKGASSHAVNKMFGAGTLQWQRGYGAVTYGKHDLEGLLRYVSNQKEHHRTKRLNRTLELSGTYLESESPEGVEKPR